MLCKQSAIQDKYAKAKDSQSCKVTSNRFEADNKREVREAESECLVLIDFFLDLGDKTVDQSKSSNFFSYPGL